MGGKKKIESGHGYNATFPWISSLLVLPLIRHQTNSLLGISQHPNVSLVSLHLIISWALMRQTQMCFQQNKLFKLHFPCAQTPEGISSLIQSCQYELS